MKTTHSIQSLKPYLLHEVPRSTYLPAPGQRQSKVDQAERTSFLKILRRRGEAAKPSETAAERPVRMTLSVATWLRISSRQEQRSTLVLVVRQDSGESHIAIDEQLCRPGQSTMFSGEVELHTAQAPISVHLALLGMSAGQAVYVDELFLQPVLAQAAATARRA